MKKFIIANPGNTTRRNAIVLHDISATQLSPKTQGECAMTQQQEYAIYYRLAKEIIESRLDAEPTSERVAHLANSLQTIEAEAGL